MARTRKPSRAAEEILKMVSRGKASSAEDAVYQRPELAPGVKHLKQVLAGGVTSTKKAVTASSGSGPLMQAR